VFVVHDTGAVMSHEIDHAGSTDPLAVLVVAGGDPVAPCLLDGLPSFDLVVAADSGVDHALALGLQVDVAVGDFDSVTEAGLEEVRRTGARIDRHRRDKDVTDLDLALDVAAAEGASQIVVVGGDGGRLDHLVANLLALGSPRLAGVAVEAHFGQTVVRVARPGVVAALEGRPGDVVTLLPLHGDVSGVTTTGLRYGLHDAALAAGATLGVSNVLDAPIASVSSVSGVLVVVVPPCDRHDPSSPIDSTQTSAADHTEEHR
jgi:thiamine pyrophosphokinase